MSARDAAVGQIRAAFAEPGFHVAAHPGRFSEQDIRQAAQKTPAILTALLRVRESDDTADFASFVLYRANNKDRIYDGALSVVTKLTAVLKTLDHELALDVPGEISAECLFTGSLEAINVTLWAVSWSWKFIPHSMVGGIESLDDIEFFDGIDATYGIGEVELKDGFTMEGKNGDTV